MIFGRRADGDVVRLGNDLDNRMNGGRGDDTITSLAGNDIVIGWEGEDIINGGIADDILAGRSGDDTLSGGDDDDTLNGGAGNVILSISASDTGTDILNGDTGSDLLAFIGFASDITFDMATGLTSLGHIAINIENVATGNGNDTISGSDVANVIDTAGGDDTVSAGGGNDVVRGGTGSDTLSGGAGKDALNGGGSADVLSGDLGRDILNGGAGRDILTGGLDRDILTGGLDRDRFVFNALAESGVTGRTRDIIVDFEAGTATTTLDRIDLSAIDANSLLDGNQSFVLVAGVGQFSATGQLQAQQAGANTILRLNTDDNFDTAEMTIQLSNVIASNLNAGDFVL